MKWKVFNKHTGTRELSYLKYEHNKEDIDYLKTFIKDKFPQYDPFIYDIHIERVVSENYKLLNEVKSRGMKESQYYKGMLIASLQMKLVGVQEPAPCAKQYVKDQYYSLYSELSRRY